MTVLEIKNTNIACELSKEATDILENAIVVLQNVIDEMEDKMCDNFIVDGNIGYSIGEIQNTITLLEDLQDMEEIF